MCFKCGLIGSCRGNHQKPVGIYLFRNVSPNIILNYMIGNDKTYIPKKYCISPITPRQINEKQFPYTITIANYIQYGLLIALQDW